VKFLKTPWGEVLITILIALIIFAGVRATLQSFVVKQQSMEPSFHDGQYILANKLTYHFSSPKRGDVIIFHTEFIHPQNRGELYIKRVIGLPGERVEINGGKIYIIKNGEKKELEEKPHFQIPYSDNCSVLVPPDHYFVLGDNRASSIDSRRGWTVPRDYIVAKTWLCYWPLSKWGLSPSYSWQL